MIMSDDREIGYRVETLQGCFDKQNERIKELEAALNEAADLIDEEFAFSVAEKFRAIAEKDK